MRSVDLRSDTVTLPSEAMREAMAHAAVGDDVFGEDPSVNRLQEMAAELLGKEAALFVPSGTMANLICLLSHSERGDEIYLGDLSHIFLNEAGGSAAVGGLHPRTLCNNEDGTLNIEGIEAAVRPNNVHFPHSRLLCLENTHNRCWGSPLSLKYLENIFELTGRLGLKTHLDGARIFNAALAEDVEVSKLTKGFDSVDKRLTSSQLLERAATKGVLSLYVGNRRFRMVTHYGLTMEDIDCAVKALQEVMATA